MLRFTSYVIFISTKFENQQDIIFLKISRKKKSFRVIVCSRSHVARHHHQRWHKMVNTESGKKSPQIQYIVISANCMYITLVIKILSVIVFGWNNQDFLYSSFHFAIYHSISCSFEGILRVMSSCFPQNDEGLIRAKYGKLKYF